MLRKPRSRFERMSASSDSGRVRKETQRPHELLEFGDRGVGLQQLILADCQLVSLFGKCGVVLGRKLACFAQEPPDILLLFHSGIEKLLDIVQKLSDGGPSFESTCRRQNARQ